MGPFNEIEQVVSAFQTYLGQQGLKITRAEFEKNLAAKAQNKAFLEDVKPMLATGVTYDPVEALNLVQRDFVARLPGAPWKGE